MQAILSRLRQYCSISSNFLKPFYEKISIDNSNVNCSNTFLWTKSFQKNDIYLEALGNGLFGSVNYERQLTKAPGLGARIGIGFYSENAFYLTIPVGINYLFQLKGDKSFIDAGLGVTWTQIDSALFSDSKNSHGNDFVCFVPSIGYRRHTANNVMWRINLAPVINQYTFVPWIGASIGKRF